MRKVFNRHDLVWLKLDAVKQAEYAGPAPMETIRALSLLHRWVLSGYPLIVARQEDMAPDCLRLGLAEPASWGKRRLSFLVNVGDVEQHQQGPSMASVLHQLPQAWQAGATALNAFLNEQNISAHVYGSIAVQTLTGLPCVTESSDLDVLFKPLDWASVNNLCAYLNAIQLQYPEFKVDGEVLNPAGDAVHWRELAQHQGQLLVKSNHAVRLLAQSEYRGAFKSALWSAA